MVSRVVLAVPLLIWLWVWPDDPAWLPWMVIPVALMFYASAWREVRWTVDPLQRTLCREVFWWRWCLRRQVSSTLEYQWLRVHSPDASGVCLELGNAQYLTLTVARRDAFNARLGLTQREREHYRSELVALGARLAESLRLEDRGYREQS